MVANYVNWATPYLNNIALHLQKFDLTINVNDTFQIQPERSMDILVKGHIANLERFVKHVLKLRNEVYIDEQERRFGYKLEGFDFTSPQANDALQDFIIDLEYF